MHNLCAFKATAIFKREIQMGKTKKHSFEKGNKSGLSRSEFQ